MNFLDTIIAAKKDSLKEKKNILPFQDLKGRAISLKDKSRFKKILEKPGTHLIAEIKRASPSKGDIRKDLDVVKVAKIYEDEGVELVSVLTEEKFFKGSLQDLLKVKQNTNLSILCKDFIIDEYQIYEAKSYGAEAILLIARILPVERLSKFIEVAKGIGIDPLVEIHDEDDLNKALEIKDKVEMVGINHRNLQDFQLDLTITQKLLPEITKGKIVICESGIESASQIKQFK